MSSELVTYKKTSAHEGPITYACLFVCSDDFTPYACAFPWPLLKQGFYFTFGGLPKSLLVLHVSLIWKVALLLPD